MRVENDEMYGDWAHWLQAPCPVCQAPLRAHHLHDFAALVCVECRQNPLLHFSGITLAKAHGPAMKLRVVHVRDGVGLTYCYEAPRFLSCHFPTHREAA